MQGQHEGEIFMPRRRFVNRSESAKRSVKSKRLTQSKENVCVVFVINAAERSDEEFTSTVQPSFLYIFPSSPLPTRDQSIIDLHKQTILEHNNTDR